MLTYNVPQCDDIIIAQGRETERCRLTATSAVKIRTKRLDKMLPDNMKGRRQRPFAPRP